MEEDSIRIKVKSIDNEEYELTVKTSMNTEEIKSIIAEKKKVNKNDIRLIYQGQCLSNEKTIADYNVQNDHIIHLVVRKKENVNTNNDDNQNDRTSTTTFRNNDSNIISDPVHINFTSAMSYNNSSNANNSNNNNSNATNNNSNSNGNVFTNHSTNPLPNSNGATPLYFTHMRVTRNDNIENDLMGQTNICSLLNDIMSQVNINPNFIYGAATAAATAAANVAASNTSPSGTTNGMAGGTTSTSTNAGTNASTNASTNAATNACTYIGEGENIFAAAMRTNGMNVNVSDFVNIINNSNKGGKDSNNSNSKKVDPNENNKNKEGEEEKKNWALMEKSYDKNNNKGTHANEEQKKEKEKREKLKRHITSDRRNNNYDYNKERSDPNNNSNDSSSSGNSDDGKSNNEDVQGKEVEENKQTKKIKKKRKNVMNEKKIPNNYKHEKEGKYHSDYSKKSGTSDSESVSSNSRSSTSGNAHIKEEKKRLEKIRKNSKKRHLKNKHKKEKMYDYNSYTSDEDDEYTRKGGRVRRDKGKEKEKRKKQSNMFDPNFLYHRNYMHDNNARTNRQWNYLYNGRKDLINLGGGVDAGAGARAYPFPVDNALRSGMFYNDNKNFLNYRDDISDTYDYMNGANIAKEEFIKNKERKKKKIYREEDYNSSSKNTFNPVGNMVGSNMADLNNSTNTCNVSTVNNINSANNVNSVVNNNVSNMNSVNNNVVNTVNNACRNVNINKSMIDMPHLLKNSNECFSNGLIDENTNLPKSNYANIVPFNEVERNNQIIRNDSFRTNSRIILNEDADGLLSDNNSVSGNMRSIQMSSDRRNSALRRSDLKCLNDMNDSEYKNVEMNIPWRVIEQLLVLLEEETGYRRPDLSSYINSYYNSNSIYVFFYLFVHINNIINSIIIQFNHANFLNNDITMSSFSRISIILSLASVIFSRLSNFFFVFYDNFYCNNYGRNYRYTNPIDHEFLREIRNLYFSNNRNNNNTNSSGRFYENNLYSNNNYIPMNMNAYNQNNSTFLNNINDNYYPLPYNDIRNICNRTNLQQEFEDYYKNYLNSVKDNSRNMLLRKEYTHYREYPYRNQVSSPKEDYLNHNKMSKVNKLNKNSSKNNNINSNHSNSNHFFNEKMYNKINKNSKWNNNNPFSLFPGQNNKPLLYASKKKRTDEKEIKKKMKKYYKAFGAKGLCRDGNSFNSKSDSGSDNSSSNSRSRSRSNSSSISIRKIKRNSNNVPNGLGYNAGNLRHKEKWMNDIFKNILKNNKNGGKINEKTLKNDEKCLKNVEKDDDKKKLSNNLLNDKFICYDSNIDDIYDLSEDGNEKDNMTLKKGQNEGEQEGKNTYKGKIWNTHEKEKKNNNISQEENAVDTPVECNEIRNHSSNQNDNALVSDDRTANNPPLPNINLANIFNNVQNQMVNSNMQDATPRDKFEGMPDEVKERYKRWVENTQIFSGQMIKICRNRRPLSNAYIGDNSSKDNVSYSNFLPFLWKKNMSTINVNFNLEISDELLNAFDLHVLEFVKKSIKNNEDYKSEKFKYPNLSLCEELFEEVEKKDK
ncbi:ubiquitin-like protein [Plasmodium brasilianum]|uniref:Ubiquitin-like protein n=1 Tax=Plasmodium brasilianum TaxID=5824 RepID=A0ACB9YCZ0_PLABR|nr:ubiquitin-like protein [Plasmodium brasilianum]